jgi:hypothetical protein
LIAKTLNIPENLSIPNKVKTIAEAYREIDKVITHYNATGVLLTNRYITNIARSKYDENLASIVTIGEKKQIWEFGRDFDTKNYVVTNTLKFPTEQKMKL